MFATLATSTKIRKMMQLLVRRLLHFQASPHHLIILSSYNDQNEIQREKQKTIIFCNFTCAPP